MPFVFWVQLWLYVGSRSREGIERTVVFFTSPLCFVSNVT